MQPLIDTSMVTSMEDARFLGEIYTSGWYLDLAMNSGQRVCMPVLAIQLRSGALSALTGVAFLVTSCATARAAAQGDPFSAVYTAVALTVSGASTSTVQPPPRAVTPAASAMPSTSAAFSIATSTLGSSYAYAAGSNNAAYISDVTVPDGEHMAPGETFTKTWALLNTGQCAWTTGYSVVFVDGTDMDAGSFDLDGAVAVGASSDVSVELTAPDAEGRYTGYWRLADASGDLFGEQFYVQIVVIGDADTLTPAPTAETATPILTTISTDLIESPTLQPTATPQVTFTPTPDGITSSPTETHDDEQLKS